VGRAKLAGVLGLMAVFILGERFGAGEVPSPP
jgi:hypothetical protein